MKQYQNFYSSKLLPWAPITLAASLVACGGTGQDIGKRQAFSQTFQGVAVDGYVARSLVFLDYDNNGTRDPWEPSAFTDNDGYYSYNPKTNTNYCRVNAPASEQIYCLVSTRPIDNAVIRVDGGYDVLTGEPFLGQMSRRQSVSQNQDTVESVVSPLTSLLTNLSTSEERTRVLASLDISESDLDVDYLNTDGSDGINMGLLNKAVKVHKVVTVLSDRVRDTYPEIGTALGTPNDLSALVYKNLANTLHMQESSLDTVLSDTTALSGVTLQTEADTRVIYDNRNLDLPPLNPTGNALPDYLRSSEHAANVVNIVNRVLNADDNTTNRTNLNGRARAIESYVIKAVEETSVADTTIENVVNFFSREDNNDLVDALIQSLSEESADLSSLVRNDFVGDDFDSSDDITNASQLPEGTQAFSYIAGKQLHVSDLDMGWAPNNLKDSEVIAFFSGDTEATNGEFVACVKYIDGADTSGSLGEGNTRGELVSGYWSLLGANANNGESYSLLLTLNFLGATYQAIMKPAGTTVEQDVEYSAFRFDYGDEIRTWYSTDGLTTTAAEPTTNADCERLLPSRVGL